MIGQPRFRRLGHWTHHVGYGLQAVPDEMSDLQRSLKFQGKIKFFVCVVESLQQRMINS